MRAESKQESPSSEGSPQKQDPLERRRLQNRLSQRNHRRKIRDRIAKLQERVIANELRAAAALRGWDQTYPPLISTRQIQSPYQEPELELSFGSEHSPQSTEPSTPFFTPYGFSPFPTDIDLSQSGELSGDPSYYPESVCSGSMLSNQPNYGYQLMGSYYDMESFHDPWNRFMNLDSPILDDSGSINQPHLYVATGTFQSALFLRSHQLITYSRNLLTTYNPRHKTIMFSVKNHRPRPSRISLPTEWIWISNKSNEIQWSRRNSANATQEYHHGM
ncbi:hypothetical protein N7490_006087 [Penicillium lividum]|nr:hypothetical protein N7490_006087 [Penicillium lividum]